MNFEKDTTHFGFEKIPVQEKTERVAQVFHSVAQKYDVMNDLMSLGIHRIWKRFALDLAMLRPSHKVLDLAGGTGDLAGKISSVVGEEGLVVLADINESMLQVGRARLLDQGILNNLTVVQANAELLPFPDHYFDRVIIGFGLRNVTHKDKALESIYRILKPGGRLIILEFSKPIIPGLQYLYDLYSFEFLPWLGEKVAGDAKSYQYLAESIRVHPDQETLKQMMATAGFENCDVHNFTGGIVAVHRGYKY